MKKVSIFLTVFLLSIAFAFIPPKHSIVGHWFASNPDGSKMYVDFKSAGPTDPTSAGKLNHYGNYTFNDPLFSINDKEDEGCGNGYWGKYNLTFVGEDSVSFAVVEDSCSGRRGQVNGGGLRREMK